MHNLTPCTDCGGKLTEAFAPVATNYVRCTRCGHVFEAARVTPMADLARDCGHTFEQATEGAPHYAVRIAAVRDADGRCPLSGLDRDECTTVVVSA